jgi:SAM-dependent MidA family methyltransferase
MWILREIEERGGEVGFRDFMELALYHPSRGYYCADREPFGRGGDFLTAPTASGWYAAVLAGLFQAFAAVANGLRIVDLAAGDGSLLRGLADALDDPAAVSLCGVERSASLRRRARRRFASSPMAVEIADVLPTTPARPAVVHASELYDAMPVHRVEQTASGLMELTVVADGNGLAWGRRHASEELAAYFVRHGVRLVPNQVAEANLDAEPSHRRILDQLGEGVVLVLDYGYPADRLYDPRGRRGGSLIGYRDHRLVDDPLEDPGEQDLTAHVNWDDLRRAADDCGWREIALMPLAEFLVRAGIGELLDSRGFGIEAELDAATFAARQEVKQLLDPEGMGSDLKMLVQGRGVLGEAAERVLFREL